ncbi:MAG: carboxypeptidase-like regulatory domain-containing protein [Saprospiraceae bacterium]
MNITKKLSFLLLLSLLIFSSCKKDDNTEPTTIDQGVTFTPINNPTNDIVVIVDGSLSGVVLDDNHQPLADAEVRVGPNTVFSDANGVFTFKNIPLNEKGALVTAHKDGYFYNSKFIRPELNEMAYTKFKLIEKTLAGSIQTNNGGDVFTNGDAKVTFTANSIKTASGVPYNGNVNVYATWLDPTGADLALEMPGDLRATNTSGEQVQLMTYGMIGVELEGDGGEALNIADGQTATIELPVPNELLGSAPSTIPLWHFNEASGIWEEDGEATLQNGKYIGSVSHFSFWNVDVPNAGINITGRILNESGGIQDLLVKIEDNSGVVVGFGYTNENGQFEGAVPQDIELIITVFDNCGDVLFTGPIGPFSEDAILDAIILDNSATSSSITLTGMLVDCDQNIVSNGYVIAEFSGTNIILQLDENGAFNSTIGNCNASELSLIGVDLTNLKESDPLVANISGQSDFDAGTINVCEQLAEYFVSTIGDNTVNYPTEDWDIYTNTPYAAFDVSAVNISDPVPPSFLTKVSMEVAPTVNVATPISYYVASYEDNKPACGPNINFEPVSCDGTSITFTSYEWTNPGDVIEATYEGTVPDMDTGEMIDVSGSFRFIKD